MKYEFNDKEHLHLLDGQPLTGTSSVGNVLAKPLTWWASGKAVETLGWTNSKLNNVKVPIEKRIEKATPFLEEIKRMTTQEFIALLDRAYRAHAEKKKEAAEKGVDLHLELGRYVKSEIRKNGENSFDAKIQPFIDWSKINVKRFIASECHCYSERLWVGGITDAVAELNKIKQDNFAVPEGTLAVIDFKSAKAAYITSYIQTAGYAIQLNENGMFSENGLHQKSLDKKIGCLIVVAFGAEKIVPELRYNTKEFEDGFEWAVGLYRLMGLNEKIKEG